MTQHDGIAADGLPVGHRQMPPSFLPELCLDWSLGVSNDHRGPIDADDKNLLRKVLCSKHHVLDALLPPKYDVHQNARKRRHD